MQGQNLTSGPIPKQLWSLAWPMMLSMFFHSLYNLVDAFWVAKISASAIAAVSISQIILFIMISLAMGISVGTSVLVGQSIGAKKIAVAERVLGQGFLLTIIAALPFTLVIFSFRNEFLIISGAVGDILPLATPYFTVIIAGSVLTFLMMMISISYNAQGDNFTMTKLFALSTMINMVLDPIFIFGYVGFPALGIAGAAYATLISQAVFIVLALRLLMKPTMMVPLHLKYLHLSWSSVKKVIDIGLPASLNQVLNPLGFSALMFFVSATFLEAGAAAFAIGFRIEFFTFIPAIGFGFAAMSMIGQNIGAGNHDRVRAVLNVSIWYGSGSALLFSLLVLIFAPYIVAIFTADPLVTEYALQYFRIVPLGYLFFAVAFIEASIFQGIGKSWPGFWITFARIGISIAISVITINVFGLEIWTVWIAIVVGSVIASLFGLLWLKRALTSAQREEQQTDQELAREEALP
ncbi:MATE family efflux transporter [Pseudoalteromonas arctica]|uniref:Multidrug-efflux transporter n=1 Tax=Pseudoalteromonas arctica TaxID=394751 RepID=A0A7Y0DS03_9GAMM|nr:MATE family efflux transporter [Pseudoalteromonas arctica]NMM40587.1 MATE family efflux transporter [Pseudoalteromonas arctica]